MSLHQYISSANHFTWKENLTTCCWEPEKPDTRWKNEVRANSPHHNQRTVMQNRNAIDDGKLFSLELKYVFRGGFCCLLFSYVIFVLEILYFYKLKIYFKTVFCIRLMARKLSLFWGCMYAYVINLRNRIGKEFKRKQIKWELFAMVSLSKFKKSFNNSSIYWIFIARNNWFFEQCCCSFKSPFWSIIQIIKNSYNQGAVSLMVARCYRLKFSIKTCWYIDICDVINF